MHHPSIGVQARLVHHLAQGRVREDRVHQVFLGAFHRARDREALNEFGDFRADHVRAEKLAGRFVEDCFDHAFGLAKRDRLAVAVERKAPDLHLFAGGFRFGFGEADARDLRV